MDAEERSQAYKLLRNEYEVGDFLHARDRVRALESQ
jgi:hypothetical protein